MVKSYRQVLVRFFVVLICLSLVFPYTMPQPARAADPIFDDTGQSLLSFQGNVSQDVALGDVDGDGDLDALVAQGSLTTAQGNVLWLNDGQGIFSESYQVLGAGISSAVSLVDLDGDGDLDAYIANSGGSDNDDQIWINQGGYQAGVQGKFLQSTRNVATGSAHGVSLGDLTGFGNHDLVVSGDDPQIWFNTGGDHFIAGPTLDGNPSNAVALGDLNNDGNLDIVLAGEGTGGSIAPSRIFWNNGDNTFNPGPALPTAGVNNDLAIGYLDGDPYLDIFIASSGADHIWWNNGDQTFHDGGPLGGSYSAGVALADLDSDQDLDVYVGGYGANLVWLNQGSRVFSMAPDELVGGDTQSVALGDLDGDGDPDAFDANSGGNMVWRNLSLTSVDPVPQGHFVDSGQLLAGSSPYSLLADLDGDGDLDAVGYLGSLQLWFNQGGVQGGTPGIFRLDDQVLSDDVKDADIGDVDGDHDLDILVIDAQSEFSIFFNQGGVQGGLPGKFAASSQALGTALSRLLPGDLDGDGDLDALVIEAHYPELTDRIRSYINQGGLQGGTQGDFADSGDVFTSTWANLFPEDGRLADLDGDGDLDAVFDFSKSPVWFNQGGTFLPSQQDLGEFHGPNALGDLDGDGDPDILTGCRVLFNQGGQQGGSPGSFQAGPWLLPSSGWSAVSLSDLDGDGDLDAVLVEGDPFNESFKVWFNDGAGRFLLEQTLLGLDYTGVALGDLDGDGDPDAFVTGWQPGHVYLNGEDTILPSLQLLSDLVQQSNGLYRWDWWTVTNAIVPLELSHPSVDPVSVRVESHYEIRADDGNLLASDDYTDLVAFAPGETFAQVTAFPAQPGGRPGEIWNPYLGDITGAGPTIRYAIRLFVETPGIGLLGPDRFVLIFYNNDSLLRSCFLEGMAAILGLPIAPPAGSSLAALPPLDLDLFRAVRDQIMASTPQGSYYAGLYAAHSTELLQVTSRHAWLAVDGIGLLSDWAPALQALIDGQGGTQIITPQMVSGVVDILHAYKSLAGPKLRAAIEREEAALDLPSLVGLNMDQALQVVQQRPVSEVFLSVMKK